jgi:broad specificity phosphatase PhoE
VSKPRLYLVRHGETDWNAAGRLMSYTDGPLNANGEAQAAAVAAALAPVHWDRAISSPFLRARRTAELILAAGVDAPALELDARLRERDMGPFEGWTDEQLLTDPIGAALRGDEGEAAGVEPEGAVLERVREFYASIEPLEGITLIVGHGRTLRTILALSLGLPPEVARRMRMRNCRPAIIEPGRRPLLLAFNAGDPAYEASATRGWN